MFEPIEPSDGFNMERGREVRYQKSCLGLWILIMLCATAFEDFWDNGHGIDVRYAHFELSLTYLSREINAEVLWLRIKV